ncbi:hypothetical protein TAMA11512_19150 [Selenomonas sp. TAMA-11512]|uniref:type I-F CRISPR-associated protein Csy1 n=1 Tax=Selenomonas sp. TAMA-11512 TaxID=3095337 RepID=UPI0030912DF3|nr:hypothetical protein TAMA11512_19150 [Selenomonas sp. TAMA-11512]
MGIFVEHVKVQAKGESSVTWLEKVLKNTSKCTLATHVGKFTHPSVDVSWYDACKGECAQPDGYVATNQVEVPLDISSGAQYLPTTKLLLLELEDGRTVYQHAENGTELLKEEVETLGLSYDDVIERLLSVRRRDCTQDSDERLRQVYFPIGRDGEYHLLTILPPSGIAMSLVKHIQAMKEEKREAEKERRPYQQIYGIVSISFGGTKYRNISTRNNENRGSAYLLPALPPVLEERAIRRPKRDFFCETLRQGDFYSDFRALHRIYKLDRNNVEIRIKREEIEDHIIDQVLANVYALRGVEAGWSDNTSLPSAQKIWLDGRYQEERYGSDEWQREIAKSFARWMITSYEAQLEDKKVLLGSAAFFNLADRILQAMHLDGEVQA